MSKALAVYRKELRQIPAIAGRCSILVFVPAFFLLLYGYALNFDIRHIALAVEDRDGSPQSRALVSAFVNSGYFDLAATVYAPAEPNACSISNDARAVLVDSRGLRPRRRGRARRRRSRCIISGDNANTATTVIGLCAKHPARRVGAELAPDGVVRPPPLASSRASGTTRSCAARCSSCPG